MAEEFYEKGRSLFELKKYEESLQAFNSAIELDPDDVLNWKDWFDCGLGLFFFI